MGGRVSVAPARGTPERGDDDAGGGRARLFKAENGVGARPTCAASSFRASISAMIFASSTSPFFSILSSPSGVRDVRPQCALRSEAHGKVEPSSSTDAPTLKWGPTKYLIFEES